MFEVDDGDAMGTIALAGQPVDAVAGCKGRAFYCNLKRQKRSGCN